MQKGEILINQVNDLLLPGGTISAMDGGTVQVTPVEPAVVDEAAQAPQTDAVADADVEDDGAEDAGEDADQDADGGTAEVVVVDVVETEDGAADSDNVDTEEGGESQEAGESELVDEDPNATTDDTEDYPVPEDDRQDDEGGWFGIGGF